MFLTSFNIIMWAMLGGHHLPKRTLLFLWLLHCETTFLGLLFSDYISVTAFQTAFFVTTFSVTISLWLLLFTYFLCDCIFVTISLCLLSLWLLPCAYFFCDCFSVPTFSVTAFMSISLCLLLCAYFPVPVIFCDYFSVPTFSVTVFLWLFLFDYFLCDIFFVTTLMIVGIALFSCHDKTT